MAKLPTVEINRDGMKVIINQSDYNPTTHILWADHIKPAMKSVEAKEDTKEIAEDIKKTTKKKPALTKKE